MAEIPSPPPYMDQNIERVLIDQDPVLSEAARELFVKYSGIPEDQILEHVKKIRAKAWDIYEFPCISRYGFLEFSIRDSPGYAHVLARLGADPGARLLDLGCCFGQDLRMMVHDGAAGKQLVGSDVEAGFVGLGYELFRDGETLGAEFCTGDFFAPDGVVGLEEGSFDFVHAASFFHLFSWEAQREAMGRAVRLLKRSPRSMLFGRQAATVEAGDVEHRWARLGTVAWRHNEESFQRLVEEVGQRVGCDLKVEQSVQEKERMPGVEIAGMWMEHRFCITFTG